MLTTACSLVVVLVLGLGFDLIYGWLVGYVLCWNSHTSVPNLNPSLGGLYTGVS